MPASTKLDIQPKANQDRMNALKMNKLRRVEQLPGRGNSGDWVVREVDGVEHFLVWMDGKWLDMGAQDANVDVVYAKEI